MVGLLNRFKKFLKDNYPGKSRAIELTTGRILRDFTIALNDFAQEHPNMPPEQILQDTDFHDRLILQDWTGKEIGGAGSIIPKVPNKSKEDPYTLLFNIVWSMVRFELSYDPTIGTEKDIKTVWDIVGSYIIEAHNYWHDNGIKTTDQKFKKNDQKLREERERLKGIEGFTLKERQEWEQLLKEERVQQREKQGVVSNSFKTKKQVTTTQAAEGLYDIVQKLIKSKRSEFFEEIADAFDIQESYEYIEVFFCVCSIVYMVSLNRINRRVVDDISEKFLQVCINQISPEKATSEDKSTIYSNLVLRIRAYTVAYNSFLEISTIEGIKNLFVLILQNIRANSPITDFLNGYISISESSGIEEKEMLKIPNLFPVISVDILFIDLFEKACTYIAEFNNNHDITK